MPQQLFSDEGGERPLEERTIEQLCFLPKKNSVLVSGVGNGQIYFWRTLLGDLAHTMPNGHGRQVVRGRGGARPLGGGGGLLRPHTKAM